MSRRAGIGIALVALLAASPSAGAASPDPAVVVKGSLTEANGAPAPFQTVRLIKTRKIRSVSDPKARAQEVEEARTRTDASGAFRFEIPADPSFPFWFVRFYDPNEFDAVKYKIPSDTDVSRAVHDGFGIEVSAVLHFHPDWPKVKALVDQYGPGSHRGQILRSLGLPTRQEPRDEGKELWVYAASGVSYLFDGDKVLETRRGNASSESAQPAEKVDPQ
ncbi:MAG TPA: hypothetical protein VFD06_12270 [Candidatus Polarisedimenticolia bacterium]|nr:hypothetical protein [Candidatus Polarisedimenticolia bacterium]